MFLVELLRSSSVTIVENGGGILRNVSAHIAMADKGESYRLLLREEQCLGLLLDQVHDDDDDDDENNDNDNDEQLRSSSLTVVSNAAGTLWNLSARSSTDQAALVELGALPVLQVMMMIMTMIMIMLMMSSRRSPPPVTSPSRPAPRPPSRIFTMGQF